MPNIYLTPYQHIKYLIQSLSIYEKPSQHFVNIKNIMNSLLNGIMYYAKYTFWVLSCTFYVNNIINTSQIKPGSSSKFGIKKEQK